MLCLIYTHLPMGAERPQALCTAHSWALCAARPQAMCTARPQAMCTARPQAKYFICVIIYTYIATLTVVVEDTSVSALVIDYITCMEYLLLQCYDNAMASVS